jgi:thiamine pyrophosphate-dependent acetolactate synthase large subunit-like protein
MDWPDPSAVAEALGGDAVTISCVGDLEKARRSIAERVRPLLIDARIRR